MTSPTSVFGFRTRARAYSLGAVGLSVAGVVGFFSHVGSTAAQAAAHPLTSAKAAAERHAVRQHRNAPHTAATQVAPAAATARAVVQPVSPHTAVAVQATTYTAPGATHAPAPAPSPAKVAPKPVTSAPKPVATTPPATTTTTTTTTTPPPTQTHSS